MGAEPGLSDAEGADALADAELIALGNSNKNKKVGHGKGQNPSSVMSNKGSKDKRRPYYQAGTQTK